MFSALSELSSSIALFPSISISDLADVDGLEGGFRFRGVGHDKVAGEAARSVSRACPRTEKQGWCLQACCWSRLIRPSNSPMNSPSPLPGAPTIGIYRQACSGIHITLRFVGRDRLLWNSMVKGTQRFRLVRATSCVIPYVLCGCLYCLRC